MYDAPENVATLIRVITSRLFNLVSDHTFPSAPNSSVASFATSFMKAASARNTTKEALNCIRVLQRVLPVVFELESETSRFEMEVFWKREEVHAQPAASSASADPQFVIDDETDDEEAAEAGVSNKVPPPESKEKQYQPSLAEKLFTCLIDLMFCCGFTLPTKLQVDHYKINYTIWYVGAHLHMLATERFGRVGKGVLGRQ